MRGRLQATVRWTALVAAMLIGVTAGGGAVAADGAPVAPLLLVFDASGSMWGQIDGENKIVIARRVAGELVDGLAAGSEVGLIAYGHRREGDCADIETVLPLGPLDRAAFRNAFDALNPKGKTPITGALEQAFAALAGRAGGATVILVSDGLETCGGDPCAAVHAAREAGAEFILHVIGFDVAEEDVSQLECAAQAGGGLFAGAGDAGELAAALDAAVALPPELPAGRLALTAVADGELQDAAVRVRDAASGEEAGGGRTYASPDTNPRLIPLPDGRYRVTVEAVGIEGDARRELEVEIAGGATVERQVDFSTGELAVTVTRNGEPADATVSVRVAGGGAPAAAGRTYARQSSNPLVERLTAGTYDVEIASVDVAGRPTHRFAAVEVAPGGRAELAHDFPSGTLRVGAVRNGEPVDAVVQVIDLASGASVAQGRTYTGAKTNPKSFVVPPGRYRIEGKAVRPAGEPQNRPEVEVTAGGTVEETLTFGP